MAVQVLPGHHAVTQAPAWPHLLLSLTSAALFVLLSGVGLALGSGGRFPHAGRWLAADRVGVAVRAVLISVVGLGLGALMPGGAPADNLLVCCGVLFVLAIPFLRLSATALFVCAAVLWMVGPLLVQGMTDVLPAFADVPAEPGGTVSRLLVTGTYPVLPYLSCLLVGLGVGRMNLRDTGIQVRLLAGGQVWSSSPGPPTPSDRTSSAVTVGCRRPAGRARMSWRRCWCGARIRGPSAPCGRSPPAWARHCWCWGAACWSPGRRGRGRCGCRPWVRWA
ncbi:heparan-alpha-glucosaminide N-acetyltransferase domain-containing protein [Kocuria rosea]|uniref:heparan-alpha-glucosaminide N-acetyltransferase domain-containing protein n=1 Tax=Kocuria rosea TaxID=1275 RepID=UPI0025413462|nr:heparan-alpha-glucosaminide N-acetyltransferase domain-containing protein [Kocuria rosea]WIG16321.1 heparan-alpha-glucosaminide N-acetyltransferase domain-containing protein [Kocuria rosea]